MKPALQDKFQKEVFPAMREKFGIKNIMAVPSIDKVSINMGVGEAITDIKLLETAAEDLAMITGQKPQMRRSRKAISNFRLKQGAPVGCRVTLRRAKMYEFLDKLMNIVLPRIRDFNGVPVKSFDGEGNYSLGLQEHSIFPEIDATRRDFRPQGMDITIVIKGGNAEKNLAMLQALGMPFQKKESK